MTRHGLVTHPRELAERYRRAGAWSDYTLIEQWQRVADAHPHNEAVVAPDGRLTYAELSEAADRIAAGLLDLGLEPGERVLFQATNRIGTVLAWYGVLKAGLVPVCTLAAHRHHEIEAIGQRAGAVAHLVEAQPKFDMQAFAAEMSVKVPSLRVRLTVGAEPGTAGVRIEDLAEAGDATTARKRVQAVQAEIDPDDVAVLQLSGGTTGTPKLVARLHHEYWYNARQYARALGWDSTARVAHMLPIVHNAGIICALHGPHSVGATSVLLPPVLDVVLPAMDTERITDLLAATAMATFAAPIVEKGTHLRRLVISGSKPPEGMFEVFENAGIWVGQLFGMAEGFFSFTPLDAPRAARRYSVGVPLSALDEIAVLAPGTETAVPDGEVGELCVRGPYTLRGYFDARPAEDAVETTEHNARAFTSEGFYRTGDLGMARVEDGFRCYSIEGRIKDVIDRGGEKISVDELDALLSGHPKIAAVSVVAMPDRRLGEKACVYVVATPGATVDLADLQAYLAERGVAKFKWPERVELVESLPRTAVGKIDKKAMREDIAARVAEAEAAAASAS